MGIARGISLVEVLVVLAVAGVLIGMATPMMSGFVERERSTAAINSLIGAVQFARQAAVTLRVRVVVCPVSPIAPGCGGHSDWQRGQLIFADRDRNAQLGAGDDVLRAIPSLPAGSSVAWRSFRNRPYLVFQPSGLTDWQNGHFLFCPASRNARDARQVVLNPQGRLRQMTDRDGDGIVEDTGGRPVRC